MCACVCVCVCVYTCTSLFMGMCLPVRLPTCHILRHDNGRVRQVGGGSLLGEAKLRWKADGAKLQYLSSVNCWSAWIARCTSW